MRTCHVLVVALGVALAAPAAASAQDADRVVPGGGITAPGWKGQVDPASAKAGRTVADSKFEKDGDALRLTIGPAAIYWNPANTATGDFIVKASFSETDMGVRSGHPHPYGVFIGGNNLDTARQSLMYCIAYGDGSFLVRQFNGATVNKADVVTAGKLESLDGIYGIRVSHNLDVVVTGFGVTK